eukprot:CAMPEP_0197686024 /NCGR_PEP_ID=MMETSP1338-20131121/101882_1 /TAXON_ID=43686 ORGANISM="Pelagodinium beii, Strain RCC1491" /NCGR_SAMPLE_ID=MMETSP1338 /ASSEMBLY_ACC=CAM_ASM_000754 /LENGTH=50 /DNA_ID=CAMNT_0043267919 /DNA_START=17 /DNA_END=169 /DNA_ORIENTATION=-
MATSKYSSPSVELMQRPLDVVPSPGVPPPLDVVLVADETSVLVGVACTRR